MLMRFGGLWQNANFVKLWTAETISVFGSMVSGAALSFTAILFLGATPVQLGLLRVAGPIAVLVDAVSFLVSALFLGMLRAPEPPPVPHAERLGMRQEVMEGLRVVLRDRILLTLAVTTLILSLSGGMIGTVIAA